MKMTEQNYKHLGCAVTIRAMVDFFKEDDRQNEGAKKKILKELRSDWVDWLSFGLSTKLANELETNPEEVRKRCKIYGEGNNNG
jgi:hypothetical protein